MSHLPLKSWPAEKTGHAASRRTPQKMRICCLRAIQSSTKRGRAPFAPSPDASLEATKQAMIDKHVAYIGQAADAGAQIVCLQEIFYGPYFCAEQTTRWYDFTEPVPDGPTVRLMQDLARRRHV